jgi:hypothetical protein
MVAMAQQLDARSFFFHPQVSFTTLSILVLKVFRNRPDCHNGSVAELSPYKLSNFGHLAKFMGHHEGVRFAALIGTGGM